MGSHKSRKDAQLQAIFKHPGFLPHLPVFDSAAVNCFKEYLMEDAEILPLSYKYGDFFIINVINTLDCVDYDKSVYERFDNTNRIMSFDKIVFKKA